MLLLRERYYPEHGEVSGRNSDLYPPIPGAPQVLTVRVLSGTASISGWKVPSSSDPLGAPGHHLHSVGRAVGWTSPPFVWLVLKRGIHFPRLLSQGLLKEWPQTAEVGARTSDVSRPGSFSRCLPASLAATSGGLGSLGLPTCGCMTSISASVLTQPSLCLRMPPLLVRTPVTLEAGPLPYSHGPYLKPMHLLQPCFHVRPQLTH